MGEVALAFVWHHHQPYYPDDVDGKTVMPWVRLHGVKARPFVAHGGSAWRARRAEKALSHPPGPSHATPQEVPNGYR